MAQWPVASREKKAETTAARLAVIMKARFLTIAEPRIGVAEPTISHCTRHSPLGHCATRHSSDCPFLPQPDGTPAVSSGLTMTWERSTSWLSSLSATLRRFSSWAIFCSRSRTRASSSSGRRGRGTSG